MDTSISQLYICTNSDFKAEYVERISVGLMSLNNVESYGELS